MIFFVLNYIPKQDFYVLLGLTSHCPITITFPMSSLVSFTFTTSWRVVVLNLICQSTLILQGSRSNFCINKNCLAEAFWQCGWRSHSWTKKYVAGVFFIFPPMILTAQMKELFCFNNRVLVESPLKSCSTTLKQSN